MDDRQYLSRRRLIMLLGMGAGASVLAACQQGGQSAAPTAAPAKPTAAPTTAPAKPATAPTTAPATAAAAKPTAATTGAAPTAPVAKPTTSAAAFDEKAIADFYRGKTVRIIVGFAPGGGYDLYSRTIAKYLPKYLPGNPQVIVENQPGAGSAVAANQTYKTYPKDGTVVANISGPLVLDQLFGQQGVEFDMAKFRYVAVPVAETYMLFVHKRVGVTKLEEIIGPNTKQLTLGGIPASTVDHGPKLLKEAIDANVRTVQGFEGTSQIRLAIEAGQVDGFCHSWQSVKTTNLAEVTNGTWVTLAQLSAKPVADLPVKAPTIPEFAKTEEQQQLLLFGATNPNAFGKVYVMPPEVPAERAAAMEAAFMQALRDPELLADAAKAKLEVDPIGAEDTRKLVLETLAMSASVKSRLEKVIKSN